MSLLTQVVARICNTMLFARLAVHNSQSVSSDRWQWLRDCDAGCNYREL